MNVDFEFLIEGMTIYKQMPYIEINSDDEKIIFCPCCGNEISSEVYPLVAFDEDENTVHCPICEKGFKLNSD